MKKFLVFIVLVLLAIVLAGLYGAIHNQISYTVSPEYFTKFKFPQFGLDGMVLPDHQRASIIGFFASWWMGIPIGLLVGGFGFIHSGHWRMLKITLWSFAVVIAFTLLFGLCSLLYGWWETRNIDLAEYQGWFIPNDIVDLRRFLCAGYMHNSTYFGGTLAIFVAAIFHTVVRIKTRKEIS